MLVQAALRNLEVVLEPVLKLTSKELADQARLDHHGCLTLSAVTSGLSFLGSKVTNGWSGLR